MNLFIGASGIQPYLTGPAAVVDEPEPRVCACDHDEDAHTHLSGSRRCGFCACRAFVRRGRRRS